MGIFDFKYSTLIINSVYLIDDFNLKALTIKIIKIVQLNSISVYIDTKYYQLYHSVYRCAVIDIDRNYIYIVSKARTHRRSSVVFRQHIERGALYLQQCRRPIAHYHLLARASTM